jgi:hypothetical protein
LLHIVAGATRADQNNSGSEPQSIPPGSSMSHSNGLISAGAIGLAMGIAVINLLRLDGIKPPGAQRHDRVGGVRPAKPDAALPWSLRK